jgi:V/A-type H+-transporting ATPase subunit K
MKKALLIIISALIVLIASAARSSDQDKNAAAQEGITLDAAAVAPGAYTGTDRALICFAATLAVSIACLASAAALGKIGSAAFGAMSEKPELGGRALIFLGLAEGIAIYGLIVAIMVLNKI